MSHLFWEPAPQQRTRAQEIEYHRTELAKLRVRWAQKGRRWDRRSICYHRQQLTRHWFFQRVEQGDPIATRRYEWWKVTYDFRGKINERFGLREQIKGIAERMDAYRIRIARGADDKGKPYAASTLKNYASQLRYDERWWAGAAIELRDFLATAPPTFREWVARQRPAPGAAIAAGVTDLAAYRAARDVHRRRRDNGGV